MNTIQEMLKTHPAQNQEGMAELAACIEACFVCAQTCTLCADACLGEPQLKELVRCISLNLDCADVCEVTGRLLSRQMASGASLWQDQLQACITACDVCGSECEKHANMHEHCRVCAEACRHCAESCRNLLNTIA